MTNIWAYWQREIAARDAGFIPTIKVPKTDMGTTYDGPIDGYWRMMGAVTKWDTPVGVWREPGREEVVMQIGRHQPETVAPDDPRLLEFLSSGFFRCSAVRKPDWDQALLTGRWPDGKLSRDPVQIEDRAALMAHLKPDIDALLYKKASDAAKRGILLPGCNLIGDPK